MGSISFTSTHDRKEIERKTRRVAWNFYACDIKITSPTSLTLFVYDIADSFSGGIGRKLEFLTRKITEFTPDEKVLLDKYVLDIYTTAALPNLTNVN